MTDVGVRWYPDKTRGTMTPPPVGSVVAWNHAAWRVVEVRPLPEDMWTDEQRQAVKLHKLAYRAVAAPAAVVLRPVRITGDDPRARDHDRHLRHGQHTWWHVYTDEHYPICAACGEPTPCREQLGQRVAQRAIEHMSRYETPGVCPHCETPATTRQKAITFEDNLEIPGGPPVTYHIGRGACRQAAGQYERRWVALRPDTRRTTLTCPGHVTNHNDGTYDCTELAECRGAAVRHESYASCSCPDCDARGIFGCYPAPTATRNRSEAGR